MNKAVLQGFADNDMLIQAVKDVIETEFTLDLLNTNMTNEAIGQVVRANLDGRSRVESAFAKIALCKSVPVPVDKPNPGK